VQSVTLATTSELSTYAAIIHRTLRHLSPASALGFRVLARGQPVRRALMPDHATAASHAMPHAADAPRAAGGGAQPLRAPGHGSARGCPVRCPNAVEATVASATAAHWAPPPMRRQHGAAAAAGTAGPAAVVVVSRGPVDLDVVVRLGLFLCPVSPVVA
jgi:hypothetical protein